MMNGISGGTILWIVAIYFLVLIAVAIITGWGSKEDDFYIGGRKSPWYLVAFGMIGASLSGVSFISLPGVVGNTNLATGFDGGNAQFSYMQVVLGYLVGYAVIALVLMPVYYRLNLTSIYKFLETRFGFWSYKTGAFFFIISRVIGASFRLYLVALVLHAFIVEPLFLSGVVDNYEAISFEYFVYTVAVTIGLIWVYTFLGGIKTIVWTDTLQTACMLAAIVCSLWAIGDALEINSLGAMASRIDEAGYGQFLYFGEWKLDPNNFFKQFLGGAAIAIVMTGLDQDMMQKNLSCKSLKDAQKNVFWFSVVLVFVNILILCLGAMLAIYQTEHAIAVTGGLDKLFPTVALQYLSPAISVIFILGLIAAAYSSADSALTSLTTSFSLDILGLDKEGVKNAKRKRWIVHIGFSLILLAVIVYFKTLNDGSVVNKLFGLAALTYGPLLGLYAFGLFTKLKVQDIYVPVICVMSVGYAYLLQKNSVELFDYKFAFELLIINGLFTFLGLLLITKWDEVKG